MRTTHDSRGGSYLGLDTGSDCPSQAKPGNGAYIGWANADGSEVIGSQVCAGQSRFGIFRGSKFTPLPALPAPCRCRRRAGRHRRLVTPAGTANSAARPTLRFIEYVAW